MKTLLKLVKRQFKDLGTKCKMENMWFSREFLEMCIIELLGVK